MGFRMYCDTYPGMAFRDWDNESPKFMGYVEEPESFRVLQRFVRDEKIFAKDKDDLGIFDNYEMFCVHSATTDYVMSATSFIEFMSQFLKDLDDAGYDVRPAYRKTMDVLMEDPSMKVIWWS